MQTFLLLNGWQIDCRYGLRNQTPSQASFCSKSAFTELDL